MAILSVEKREPYVFKDIAVKGVTTTLEKLIELDCRAKRLLIIIPLGPEGDLQVKAYFKTSKDTPRQLVNFVGSVDYFDGDDVVFDIPLDVPIEAYSTLVVEGKNLTDAVTGFDYNLDVIIDVEYKVQESPQNG